MQKSVGIEIRKASNLMTREVSKFGKDFPDESMTEMHGRIVRYLMEAGDAGVMQKDIERAFTIRKSTASRILSLMEKNDIIERHGVDYDARLKRITLTEKARKTHQRISVKANELEKRITRGIPQEKLDIFFEVLEAINHNLTA